MLKRNETEGANQDNCTLKDGNKPSFTDHLLYKMSTDEDDIIASEQSESEDIQ